MVIGVEVNMIEITRLQDTLTQDSGGFLRQTFTINEQLYCLKHRKLVQHLAARLAAKEAVLKILGMRHCADLIWTDIDIRTSLLGCPYLDLEGRALENAHRLGINQWHLSLTHTHQYAGAFVIAQITDDATNLVPSDKL